MNCTLKVRFSEKATELRHPYGNKRMTLVHLRQIDGNCYKVTEDVDPSAEYRFRNVETEMDE